MESCTNVFREKKYLVLRLMSASRIKNKTVMSWSSRKKKESERVHFSLRLFCSVCILYQCIK